MQLSTLFESYELGETRRAVELMDLVNGHSDARVKLATSLVSALFDELARSDELDELAESEGDELAEVAEDDELAEGEQLAEPDEPEQD